MRLFLAVRIAQRALRRNKMRSSLTMLGVIIGVAAVIAMLAIGQGAHTAIRAQIASLGANTLIIQPGSLTQSGVRYGWGGRSTLRLTDVQAIRAECPSVAQVTPIVGLGAQVVYANQNWATTVRGTGIEYPDIREWPVLAGLWFTTSDIDAAAKVAVLGETVRTMLFGSVDPVGQVFKIKNVPFTIVGLLAPKGQSAWGQDQDDVIFVPYTTAQKKLLGWTALQSILVATQSSAELEPALNQVTALLRQRHGLQASQEDDFSVQSLADLASTEEESSRIMTLLLGSIASISLFVGGIGIMNIMLVSVTERTREIGIRLAVGAKRRDILWQFLTEAMTLSLCGGVVGIILGASSARIISAMANWPTIISWGSVFLAVVFAGVVGIFFGWYPAYKAAQLEPVQALRYE